MNIQKIGPFQIEWTGIKSVLKHALITALATIVIAAFAYLDHFNFGSNQAIATIIIGVAFKWAQKFFFAYDIVIPTENQ